MEHNKNGIGGFFKEIFFSSSRKRWLFLIILLVATLSRTLGISNPKDFYFDEVYHGYTAVQYAHNNPDAYDPWAKSPVGKANEWTHPPLSKLMMAGMIKVFGENSFGWRIGSAVTGVLSIVALGWLAYILFGVLEISLLAMVFLSIETLHLTQSRIAMNDSYFCLFTLLTVLFYAYFRKNLISKPQFKYLFISGFFLGLCFATKWTAFYVLGILGLDGFFCLFNSRILYRNGFLKLVFYAVLALIVLPALVYLACYLHYFLLGFSWQQFKELQWQMWAYHTGLKATHSYQSRPWQWIFNVKPVWMFVEYLEDNSIRNIYNIGNSVLLIYGLFSAFFLLTARFFPEKSHAGFSQKDRKKNAVSHEGILGANWVWQRRFLLLCYFFLWVPWIFSPRIMLFYHYLPAVPFLILCLACHLWWARQYAFQKIGVTLAVAFLLFVFFLPLNTGIKMPRQWMDSVYHRIPGLK